MDIAIVVVAYNRFKSVERLVESLLRANYTKRADLIISIDKSNTDIVENYADLLDWPHGDKVVSKHDKNLGLRNHMLSLGKYFEKYDALIILEDDLIVSPAFFNYASQTVGKYSNNNSIAGISLYAFPLNYLTSRPFTPQKNEFDVFFMQTAQSWGEIWLKNQWFEFHKWYLSAIDFIPTDDVPESLFGWKKSWLKYHTRYCIENEKYFVYPYNSFSSNCGESGTHSTQSYNYFQCSMQTKIVGNLKLPTLANDAVCYDAFFENLSLYHCFDLPKDDLCIDINDYRKKYSKRYVLTTKILPYHILKSYGLQRFPIEENVVNSVPGKTIFLYDTQKHAPSLKYNNKRVMMLYQYRIKSLSELVYLYGVPKMVKDLAILYMKKIYHLLIK